VSKVHASSGRSRLVVIFLLTVIVLAACGLWHWGTAWTVPSAVGIPVRYKFLGYWDGAGSSSGKLLRPIGIAVASNGDVYVTDARIRVVRLASSGEFKGEWGREGKGHGEFGNPVGIAVAPDGSVFVSDYDQDRIRKFTSDGRFLLSFGASGKDRGRFTAPAGLAVDSSGSLYVADFYNHRVQKFRSDGSFEMIFGHPGRMGAGTLHYPTGVAVTPEETLLVADAYNYRIQWFDAGGNPVRRIGDHLFWLWPLRTSSKRGFKVPTGVAVGSNGLIHVADSGNHRIVMLSAKGEYVADWSIPDSNPKVFSPEQVAVSRDGETVYATDLSANRILILAVERQPAFREDGPGKR
jgi:DNA-binding beta-propeller fold protein YncE